MKKRVLFHYSILNVGGAEKSTLRMLRALCDRGWEVTLVLTTGGGALESEIDPRVRVVRLQPRTCGHRFAQARGPANRLRELPDLGCYALMRLIGVLRMVPFLFRRYETAAVLLMGMSSQFTRRVVRASLRVVWIRNDLAGADPTGAAARSLRRAAHETDLFICVSKVARRSLLAAVPEAADKAVVIYNILDSEGIRARATETGPPFQPPQDGRPVVLSVCRLSERAKGLTRMVRVCRALAEAGISFHWYVAGDGLDRSMLEREIERQGMGARMTLLGPLANPFPTYRAADLVAMLSHYEGLSGVVNEARILGKPVIATRVSGIDEQLEDGVNGIIVEQDEAAIVVAMASLLADSELRGRLADGGYPAALLDDAAKLDRLEALLLGRQAVP